jgi:hypothetical protein
MLYMFVDAFLFIEKGDRRCPYLPPADDETRILDLRDQILVRQYFHFFS